MQRCSLICSLLGKKERISDNQHLLISKGKHTGKINLQQRNWGEGGEWAESRSDVCGER